MSNKIIFLHGNPTKLEQQAIEKLFSPPVWSTLGYKDQTNINWAPKRDVLHPTTVRATPSSFINAPRYGWE